MSSITHDADAQSSIQKGSLIDILKKNPKRFERIQFLAKLFCSGGYELRIAGGAVRDILRGTSPQDIDFATTAKPEQSKELVSRHEDKLRIIVTAAGEKHGTVAVKFKELDQKKIKLDTDEPSLKDDEVTKNHKKPEYDDEPPFEITTLRCDTITDGRHAQVEFINDWKKDAERRDLTINAMFLTLDTGALVDYFGGESDLRNGIIRFVGDAEKRVREDYLRILRFFRFWSVYGRHNLPDSRTMETLKTNMEGLSGISGERISTELKKILSHPPCQDVTRLMLQMDLHHIGLPNRGMNDSEFASQVLDDIRTMETHIVSLKLNNAPLLEQLDKKVKDLMPILLLSAILRTLEDLKTACDRLKFSNLERDTLHYIIANRCKNLTLENMKKDLALAHVSQRSSLLIKMVAYNISRGQFRTIDELLKWKVPIFPMLGSEIVKRIKHHGLPTSQTKVLKTHLEELWAESDYTMSKSDIDDKMEAKLIEMKVNQG